MKNTLTRLKFYTSRLLKESVFLTMLVLDIIGMLTTYYVGLRIPNWIFIAILFFAFFIGGFNIYRQGTAEIRVEFANHSKDPECYRLSDKDLIFDISISGYVSNFGPQSGVLENVECKLFANGIKDDYLLSRIFSYEIRPLQTGNINPLMFSLGNSLKPGNKFGFPFVIAPSITTQGCE